MTARPMTEVLAAAARIVERHDRVTADMRRQYPSMKMPEPADSVLVARALLSTSSAVRGMRVYWSDWHGMPEPTHWMRYSRPGSTPAAPAITQAELVELLALMDAADSALDKDTYDQSLRDEFDAPDDADYSVCAGTVRKCSAVFAAIEKLRNRMRKP